MQVVISERASKEFSRGMTAIEEAGKAGTFGAMSLIIDKMTEFLGSPFIKTWSDLLGLMQVFFDAGGAEAAAKWREELFNEKNIEDMRATAAAWHDITNAITDFALSSKTAYSSFLDGADKWGEDMEAWRLKFWANIDQWGEDMAAGIEKAWKDALDDIDLAKIIKDWIEDELEED